MGGLAFNDFDALPDVLATDRFQILITPTSAGSLNATLAVRCNQITIPEEQTEPMLVQIQGMEFSFRGRRVYDKLITATFVETTDAAVTQGIRTWTQNVAGGESQNGQSKKQYATVGTINVFDQSGNTAMTFQCINMWPSAIPAVQLDGSNAQPYLQQISFTYDKFSQTFPNVAQL